MQLVALWEPLRRRLLAVQLVRFTAWADPALSRSHLGRPPYHRVASMCMIAPTVARSAVRVAVGLQGESASPPLAEALSAKGQLPGDGACVYVCVCARVSRGRVARFALHVP